MTNLDKASGKSGKATGEIAEEKLDKVAGGITADTFVPPPPPTDTFMHSTPNPHGTVLQPPAPPPPVPPKLPKIG